MTGQHRKAIDDARPDPLFADPCLAELYDLLFDDRSDLEAYEAIVAEVGAVSVLDVGCGTGTLACRLAARGVHVVGLDPAAASLAIARIKPHADRVQWKCLPAWHAPALGVDLVLMTANVAQVFVSDDSWGRTLHALRGSVRDGGWLVFETRDPVRRAWEDWTPELTRQAVELGQGRRVITWIELLAVEPPLVSFRHVFDFGGSRSTVVSDTTLRFRHHEEIAVAVQAAGFALREVRDAPDRPGKELVFLAQALDTH